MGKLEQTSRRMSVLLRQVGDLTDVETRVVLHLVIVGYSPAEAIDILVKHLYNGKKHTLTDKDLK